MHLLKSVLLELSVLAAFAIAQPVIEERKGPVLQKYTYDADKWCGIHVVQYQKNAPSGDEPNHSEYVLHVVIYDDGKDILSPQSKISEHLTVNALNGVPSPIPAKYIFEQVYVTVGAVDDDAILFSYGNQSWGSNDQEHHSNFGAYDGGKREGDTGFTCRGTWIGWKPYGA